MKKFLIILCILFCLATLGSCSFGTKQSAKPNYNADIEVVTPENITIDNFVVEENTTYYTSPGFSLWLEVNGKFFEMKYFSLDGNKRVYDNVYLYEDDYFYIVTDDYDDLYASLQNAEDKEFAEEEKEQGYDIQLNVKKSGIYKLVFDLDTLKFDMEFKTEIQEPIYYAMASCSIYTKKSEWVEMSQNPSNENEFVISDFNIGCGETVSFFDKMHVSWYKVTLEDSIIDKLASDEGKTVTVNVGGNYNVFVNKKTYEVRLELTSFDSSIYSCVYYDGKDILTLSPYEQNKPYIFRQRLTVTTKLTTSVPNFYTSKYKTYNLTIQKSSYLIISEKGNGYFKEEGTYDIIINLKTFEISVEKLPE